jgi:hypothetical protein
MPNALPYLEWLHSVYKFSRDESLVNCRMPLTVACSAGDLPVVQWLTSTFHYTARDLSNQYTTALRDAAQSLPPLAEGTTKLYDPEYSCYCARHDTRNCGHVRGYSKPISEAARSGNFELVRWLSDRTPAERHRRTHSAINACKSGHYDIAVFLFKLAHEFEEEGLNEYDYSEALCAACVRGDLPIAKLIWKNTPSQCRYCMSQRKLRTLMNDVSSIAILGWLTETFNATTIGNGSRIYSSGSYDSINYVCGPIDRQTKKLALRLNGSYC